MSHKSDKVMHSLLFSPLTVNNRPFPNIFSGMFYASWGFLLLILLLKMASSYSAEMLLGDSKHKKCVMCLVGKICVLNKLHSGMI